MHREAHEFVARTLAALPPRKSVIEVGSRDINGGIRHLLNGAAYTGLDLYEGPGVDIVTDAATWAPPEPVDTVICCEVLEHCAEAEKLCRVAFEWLEQGGVFVVTAAGPERPRHSGIDGGPLRENEPYQAISREALRLWLIDFGKVQVEVNGHDIYATARKLE